GPGARGEVEHGDGAAPGGRAGEQPVEPGDRARTEHELVDDDVAARQDRRLHRRGGNRERLEQERPDEEGQEDRDESRLREFRRVRAGRQRTSRNIRSHRVREKKWIATPASWRIFATGPCQMWELGSAS